MPHVTFTRLLVLSVGPRSEERIPYTLYRVRFALVRPAT